VEKVAIAEKRTKSAFEGSKLNLLGRNVLVLVIIWESLYIGVCFFVYVICFVLLLII